MHAISTRGPANPRPDLAHCVVEIPGPVPEPRARRMGPEAELSCPARIERRRYSEPDYPRAGPRQMAHPEPTGEEEEHHGSPWPVIKIGRASCRERVWMTAGIG